MDEILNKPDWGNGTGSNSLPRILVIDDEEPIRKLLERGLSGKYDVVAVSSAEEAADKINSSEFNVIICDLYMPDISGKEFFDECRKALPDIPFIFLTGQPRFNDAINFIKEGAFYYLTKPVDFNLLNSMLEKAVLSKEVEFRSENSLKKAVFKGYKIVKTLGVGNSGTVLLAEKDGIFYSIKILRKDPDAENYANRLKRFMQEYEILRQINHPNIVKIYDFTHDEGSDSPYIIMEYIHGRQLSEYISNKTPLSFAEKIYIINQIAYALDYVHRCDILHRDVKPENILVSDDLTVKLTDFGICKVTNSGITITSDVMGSPAYMSPESFDSAKILDRRSDLFSIGVICYELFTGIRPFPGDNFYQLMESIRGKKPEAPKRLNPEIPNWLQDIMAKLLDKNPDKRFSSAMEVMKAINFYVNSDAPSNAGSITSRILKSLAVINNVWR